MLCRHFLKGFEKSMVALIWNGCTPFPLMMQSKVFLYSHKLGAFSLHTCHSLSFEILFPCGTQAFLNTSILSEEIYYHYGQLSGAHKILCRLRIFSASSQLIWVGALFFVCREFLLSVRGLGLKSVECIRLLTLHQLAFPVS
jgi:hypothetical protein